MKRAFDLSVALAGLALLWPFLAVIGLAAWLTSGGPVLFVQERAGRGGRPFRLLKFRTMSVLRGAENGLFEPGSRVRVTPFGRILRAYKIDELPQLWNVLKGEMSFVGPRPEIRKWVEAFPDRWGRILSVTPGITDPASVVYRHEEEILAASSDPDETYRSEVLPHKLDLYEDYIESRSFWGDVRLILTTLAKIVGRTDRGSSRKG
jgi:lipopolysaccharide/colanic/teichoic acid biosynthesis glycosyltransferase